MISTLSFAQVNCKVEYYSGKDGLAHSSVTAIVKDRDGFMWLGTWNGLNRFDGKNFKTYKPSLKGNSYLESKRIVQILDGENNLLWIKTYDKQVYWFDKKTEKFATLSTIIEERYKKKILFNKILHVSKDHVWLGSVADGLFRISTRDISTKGIRQFREAEGSDNILSSNEVNFLHEDKKGKIWIGTINGLNSLIVGENEGLRNTLFIIKETLGLNITKFEEDRNQIYFSTAQGILIVYNKQTQLITKRRVSDYPINNIFLSKRSKILYLTDSSGKVIGYDIDNAASKIYLQGAEEFIHLFEDSRGNLWLEPSSEGVVFWNRTSGKINHFYSPSKKQDKKALFSCFEDINDVVWVSMKGGGFGYYDYKSASFVTKNEDMSGNYTSFPQLIYSLHYDPSGVVWLCTEENGLIKMVLRNNNFDSDKLVKALSPEEDPEVRSLMFDTKGRLWVGTKSGSLVVKKNDTYTSAPIDKLPVQGFSGIYAMLEDKSNTIWIATKNKGLYVATPKNQEQTDYSLTHYDTMNSTLQSDQIYTVLQDHRGDVWLGTFDKGLIKVQWKDGLIDFKSITFNNKTYPQGSFDKIRYLTVDDTGNIWIATTFGLVVYSQKGHFRVYRDSYQTGNGIGGNDLQYILKASNGDMWLCTSGGGLTKATGDPFTGLKFKNYTDEDGLSNDYILSGAEDSDGNLWLATEGGISKFDLRSEQFFPFDAFHEQPGFNFSEKTVAKSPYGEIIWGTSKGTILLDPSKQIISKSKATLVFSGLQVNNKDLRPNPEIDGQAFNIQYADKIILNYDQNNISIDFTITDHRYSQHNYLYRLQGLDSTWHTDKQLNRVTFTNLSPGQYCLEVKAQSDLYTVLPYKSLAIIILPPWWHTWWAYTIYFVLLLCIATLVWRILSTMIDLKNKVEIEKKVAEMKMDFFTNVSHELRTPLTLILSPVKQLLGSEKLSSQGEQYLNMVYRNATRMETFVNQLLDLRKIQENKFKVQFEMFDVIALSRQVIDNFRPIARERRMTLKTSFSSDSILIQADENHIETILFNILSNSFKYSPDDTEIVVSLDEQQGVFNLQVSDQGCGVSNEMLNNIFELFYVESKTVSKNTKGTGIGLALAKELVDLHNGQIRAFNNDDRGLSVIVTLPVVQQKESHIPQQVRDETASEQQSYSGNAEEQKDDVEKPVVLIVEDNEDLMNFLKMQLNLYYKVLIAHDGIEGLAVAEQQIPDLIISDIMMPHMDGITMLAQIRQNTKISHIPIVLLSAKHAIESQIEGIQYGADFYITKPFHTEFLLSSVNNLIRRRTQFFSAMVERREVVLKPSDLIITDTDEKFLKNVVQVVEERMSDPDFNIDMVADGLHMSRNTFYKKFKSLTKIAPIEFVRDMRLQRAYQVLGDGRHTVAEVAYMVGFNNPKYFSTCFKDKFGVSPKEFSKSL
ncbi:hybrid sensor histidine kinase/response regulator [Sphingobacterium alkalisoli]|nr:hybrid sensor histidine kinase/response regulator [Sphingobacterium alkalisoli]